MYVLLFWASWYPECETLRETLQTLAENMTHMVMTWCDVDQDKEIIKYYEVTKVPFLLLMHPSKRQIEYIKQPRANTLAKVIGAYEEYYREQFVNERAEAF